MDDNDLQLIRDYFSGDKKALEILFGKYLKSVYNFVYRYLNDKKNAEDITQEVFLKAFISFKKFNQNKNFKTWLFSIARNLCIDFFRKKKMIPFSDFENDEEKELFSENIVDSGLSLQEIFENKETIRLVNTVIETLPLKYRMVLFLYYNENFNFREIAEILDEPLFTITARHRRALIKIKEILTKNTNELNNAQKAVS